MYLCLQKVYAARTSGFAEGDCSSNEVWFNRAHVTRIPKPRARSGVWVLPIFSERVSQFTKTAPASISLLPPLRSLSVSFQTSITLHLPEGGLRAHLFCLGAIAPTCKPMQTYTIHTIFCVCSRVLWDAHSIGLSSNSYLQLYEFGTLWGWGSFRLNMGG